MNTENKVLLLCELITPHLNSKENTGKVIKLHFLMFGCIKKLLMSDEQLSLTYCLSLYIDTYCIFNLQSQR